MKRKKLKEMVSGSVFLGPTAGDNMDPSITVPGGSDFYAKGDYRIPKVLGSKNIITRRGSAGKRKRKKTLFDSYFNKSFYPDRIVKELNTSFVITITQKNLERIIEHMVRKHTTVYDTDRNDHGHLKIIFDTDDDNFDQLTNKLTGMFEDRLNKSIFLNIEKIIQPILTETEDYLEGGLADNMDCKDLAKEKGVSVKKMKHMVHKIGAKVEKEHTNNHNIAAEIARDHIKELGMKYYPELDKMEKKIKKLNKHK